uniref:PCI domain-containing protein n=1 Tax=Acrobeloides nanus TaxID=290746 RepID=A0A914C3R3_9BILA
MEPEDEYRIDEPLADDFDMINQHLLEEDIGGEEKSPAPDIVKVNSTKLDLDSLSQNYTDYGLMKRLVFIADVCPPLQYEALGMLANYIIKNTQNVAMLVSTYQKFDKAKLTSGNNQANAETMPPIDNSWIETTTTKATSQLESLLAESKRQKDEGVKESIRRSMEEVFHQHVQMGNLQEALKLYGRGMREYCTAPNYVIQMLLNWINVTIYADQWNKLDILLPQAERAIAEAQERESIGATSTSRPSMAALPAKINAAKTYKELIQSSKAKVFAVTGLYRMHGRNYKSAADSFIQVDLDALNYPQLLSSNDVAIYGTLCALATFDRNELKERVLGSTLFRKFLESEPKLVELLQKFCKSAFGTCLDILEELRDQLLLNMYLAPHLDDLYSLIRRRAIIQYCAPYVTTDIRIMAGVFRTSAEELEEELVKLIELGSLSARIDSFNKILHARSTDQRAEIYQKIITLRKSLDERAYGILLRAALQQNKIIVGHGDPVGKGQGRRRPATHNLDDSDESTPHDVFMEEI